MLLYACITCAPALFSGGPSRTNPPLGGFTGKAWQPVATSMAGRSALDEQSRRDVLRYLVARVAIPTP